MCTLMVTKGMPSFWAIFYLSDLQCPIVLWLVGVDIGCFESTTSVFCYVASTINPVIVAIFFHKTYRKIFDHLLRARSSDDGLFGLVSTYFGIVVTNKRGILHLYCLVWLKRI